MADHTNQSVKNDAEPGLNEMLKDVAPEKVLGQIEERSSES
jgi:hypothetical protein